MNISSLYWSLYHALVLMGHWSNLFYAILTKKEGKAREGGVGGEGVLCEEGGIFAWTGEEKARQLCAGRKLGVGAFIQRAHTLETLQSWRKII